MVVSANGKSSSHNIVGVPASRCYYCGKELDFEFDYSCITCGHITCNIHQEICQDDYDDDYMEKGCDLVTCIACYDAHVEAHHSSIP